MIDDKQIRAARALLNWTQDILAEASGVARATIKNVENGNTLPRLDTMQTLQSTFEAAGVEFLPGSGVRMRDNVIELFKGPDANRKLLEDVYTTLRDTGGEMLVAHLSEKDVINSVSKEFLDAQIKKRREAKITSRLIVRENETSLIPPYDSYRILSEKYFSPYPFYIYGNKLALVSWEPSPSAIVIKDARFAHSAKGLFDFVWDRTQMPGYKGSSSP